MHKRIQLYKTVEYLSLHFRLNAKARIGHIKTQMSFIHLIISYTYTSRSGELDGIVDKVGYDLIQTVPVTDNPAFRQMMVEENFHTRFSLHLHEAHNVLT